MLQFTDLNHFNHFIELSKITNAVIRPQDSCFIATFHFGGAHVVSAHVEAITADRINFVLSRAKTVEYES